MWRHTRQPLWRHTTQPTWSAKPGCGLIQLYDDHMTTKAGYWCWTMLITDTSTTWCYAWYTLACDGCLSVCLSVTSRRSGKTSQCIKLVFDKGTLPLTYPTLYCNVIQVATEILVFPLDLCTALWTQPTVLLFFIMSRLSSLNMHSSDEPLQQPTTTTPQPFYGPFSGTTQVSWCQKRTSGLYGAREDLQRQTHWPSGWAPLHPD